MFKKIFTLFLVGFAAILHGASYLIEAEYTTCPGKFMLESNKLASNKFILRSFDTPATAYGKFEIPESGTYNIYLRNFGYGTSSRQIALEIDGKKFAPVGDEKNNAFQWSKYDGQITLQKGVHSFKFITAGSNVRFDALLLTTGDSPEIKAVSLIPYGGHRYSGKLRFRVKTDKNPLTYTCGEDIKFIATARVKAKTVKNAAIAVNRFGDDGKRETVCIPFENGKAVYTTQLSKPGFVRAKINLCDTDGNTIIFVDDKGVCFSGYFDGGAGADTEKIPQMPEPEDFDAFWAKQKARLDAVPVKAEMTLLKDTLWKNHDTYAVSVDCAGPRPVTGYLTLPKNAKEKSLDAIVCFPGYGLGRQTPSAPTLGDQIVFRINAHGMPLGKDKQFYDQFFAPLRGYALNDSENADTCYFNGMALRVMRALQFVKSLPLWNGKNLTAYGGSQGGLQALWAAGLDPDVSYCTITVPWGCNRGETELGLMGRDSVILSYHPAARYYDPVNFAKRIKCKVDVHRAGLADYICPPSGVSRMYHNLKCPKSITWVQNNNHFPPQNDCKSFSFKDDNNHTQKKR